MTTMGGNNGWFTARKSNAQIALDKKRAQDTRRRERGLPAKQEKKKAKKKPAWEESDDEDSIDDFIVNDDEVDQQEEEEEADWSEGDEELDDEDADEITESSPVTESSKQKARPKLKNAGNNSSSNEDSDDEDDFLSMSEPTSRKSKPAPHFTLHRKREAMGSRNSVHGKANKAALRKKPAAASQNNGKKKRPMESSVHEKEQKPAPKKSKMPKRHNVLSLASDDDDDDELLADPFARSTAPKPADAPNTAKVPSSFARRKGDKDENDEDEPTPIAARRSKHKRPRAFDEEEDDGPAVARTTASIQLDDSDDEDEDMKLAKKASLVDQSKPSVTIDIVDSEDEDEKVALDLAISESMNDAHKSNKKNRFSKFSANHKSVLEQVGGFDDEKMAEDEPEDEDEDYGEEEVDKDALEARTILETAKRLSGQILRSLSQWGGSNGMIVQDGAIAFHESDAAAADDKVSSDWICGDTMKRACPNVELAPYQLIGVNWLALLHKLTVEVDGKLTNVNGVLADEMGLGKTCQTICFLAWLKLQQETSGSVGKSGRDGSDDERLGEMEKPKASNPHLIVVPASVLSNWVIEFEKFAPHLNVVKYHGSEREEIKEYLRQFLNGKAERRGESLDVILAPITYFQKEKSDDRSFLRKFKFDYLVCDEAHLLKNHQGQRYRNLDRFRSDHRLLLSGTPIMNNPQELLSLLCFLMPLFSRKSQGFASDEDANDGGSRMLQHFVELDKKEGDKNDAQAYKKLKELFAPFVLRRRKQDVLSQIMPPKTRKVEFVDLDPVGRRIYDGVLEKHVKNKDSRAREHLFTQLRKAAHHPLLLRTRYLEPSEKQHLVDCFYKYGAFRGEGCTREKVAEELEKFNDFDIHLTALELLDHNSRREDLRRYVLREEDLFSSSKCQRLRTLLPDLVSKGHRVLVFSVWTNCLDLLSCLLEQLSLKFLRMEGSTAVSERQSLIDEFNRDESIPIFLLSTKACGLGINLTAADTCIMHDIDFNPFNDLQAEDRCHRIGQKKPVTIYKLVAKDTVDQDIHSMQERKAKMSAAIMESSSSNFETKNERENVLKAAVDRFMSSPSGRRTPDHQKENGLNVYSYDSL